MSQRRSAPIILLSICCTLAGAVAAEGRRVQLEESQTHAGRWNAFADAVYALHRRRIAGRDVRTENSVGGYFRQPEFYREVKYFDRRSGRHLSTIRWEREHPDRIHHIAVYIYDTEPDGRARVVRDYSVLYLTHSRSAPQHALINLHAYNGGLHAVRQFDATDIRNYELCEGRWKGRNIDIRLDDLDIINMRGDPESVMHSAAYRACFEGLPEDSAGVYLTPQ